MKPAYARRVLDDELDFMLTALPAVCIEGPRGVGKTETASQRARSIFRLDDPDVRVAVGASMTRVVRSTPPVLIDEWQRIPESWDVVRRAVDDGSVAGSFLLTGSGQSARRPTHSGAGRIVSVRMRPMTLAEREVDFPTVSLAGLFENPETSIEGESSTSLQRYVEEILAGGFPGMRHFDGRARARALSGYVTRLAEVDLPEIGVDVRHPSKVLNWLKAYASVVATTTSWEKIRNSATPNEGEKPARSTTIPYRSAIERLWVLDPLHAWSPGGSDLSRLGLASKHYLADPALSASLLGLDAGALLTGKLLGQHFESLAALSVRVFAQACDAKVTHFRTQGGDREIDFIVERGHNQLIACEAKATEVPTDEDVRHLLWLKQKLGEQVKDLMILTTGRYAYRRPDGVAVVPLALLGP